MEDIRAKPSLKTNIITRRQCRGGGTAYSFGRDPKTSTITVSRELGVSQMFVRIVMVYEIRLNHGTYFLPSPDLIKSDKIKAATAHTSSIRNALRQHFERCWKLT